MPEENQSTFYRNVLQPGEGEQDKSGQQKRLNDDIAFVERFKARQDAYPDTLGDDEKEAAALKAEQKLWWKELEEMKYGGSPGTARRAEEVGPAYGLRGIDHARRELRAIREDVDTAENIIEDKFSTADKWRAAGRRRALAEKFGLSEITPGKIKADLSQIWEEAKYKAKQNKELYGNPLGVHTGLAKLHLGRITSKSRSPEEQRAGWKGLAKELVDMGKAAGRQASGFKEDASDRIDREWQNRGREPKTRAVMEDKLRELAVENYRESVEADKRSSYLNEEEYRGGLHHNAYYWNMLRDPGNWKHLPGDERNRNPEWLESNKYGPFRLMREKGLIPEDPHQLYKDKPPLKEEARVEEPSQIRRI